MNLESPKASFVEWKSKGGTFFEVTYPTGWVPQFVNGTGIQNCVPIPANRYYDASVPSSWDISLTFIMKELEVKLNIESS